MTDTDAPEWPDPADKAHAVEQAKRLCNQVAEGGQNKSCSKSYAKLERSGNA